MPFDRNPKVIAKIVAQIVTNDSEIAAAMEQSAYDLADMQSEIIGNPGTLWEVVHDELRKYETAERELTERVRAFEANSEPEPKAHDPGGGRLLTLLQGAASLYVAGLAVYGLYRLIGGWRDAEPQLLFLSGWIYVIVWLVLVFFIVISSTAGKSKIARLREKHKDALSNWEKVQKDLDKSLQLGAWKANVENQKAHIFELLTGRVRQEIIAAINRRTERSYKTTFSIRRTRGFAEIYDQRFTIYTPARRRLEYLLNNMPGGSIGIAGPRGAGKTTLIRTFCGPKRVIDKLHGKPVLGILVSAPVAYQARDFLLYLFSTACQKVIEAEGEAYTPPELFQDLPQSHLNQADLKRFLYIPPVLTRFGLWLLAFGIVLALAMLFPPLIATDASRKEQAITMPASQTNEGVHALPGKPVTSPQTPPIPTRDSALASIAASTPPLTPVIARSSTATSKSHLARLLELMRLDPSSFVTSGIALIVLGCLLGEIIGLSVKQTFLLGLNGAIPFTTFSGVGEVRQLDDERIASEKLGLDNGLIGQARSWLRNMKFQQSYTSGWSGSLKLPIGMEGGINRAMSLAQNQLSMPEITYFLSEFLDKVSLTYRVIVGIDELDKLASDEAARQFVNDIKSVFGLDRCFYLVSVSENAMSSFERRGLPFRDEFDSAFDDLIYVDHLDFEAAAELLDRRVVGRPIPFFALSYCLSGGLPRDLIRSFRAVIEASQAKGCDQSLAQICDRVVCADILAKLRATATAAKKIELEPYVDSFLECLHAVETTLGNEARIHEIIGHMLDFEVFKFHAEAGASLATALDARRRPATARDEASSSDDVPAARRAVEQKLQDLIEEIAIYLKFCATLREFFGSRFDKDQFIAALECGAIDRLARGRQQFSLDPRITLAAVDTFRHRSMIGF